MIRHLAVALATVSLLGPLGTAATQPPTAGSAAAPLTIRGLDGRERVVTTADLARLVRHDTTVSAHEVSGRYSGVALTDLLALVGAPLGDSLRGRSPDRARREATGALGTTGRSRVVRPSALGR